MNNEQTPVQIQQMISEIDAKIHSYLTEIRKCMSQRSELAAIKIEMAVKELMPDFKAPSPTISSGPQKSTPIVQTTKPATAPAKENDNKNPMYNRLMKDDHIVTRGRKRSGEKGLKDIILSIFERPMEEIRKKIPSIPSNANGLKVIELKNIIDQENLFRSSSSDIANQISAHVSSLKKEGHIKRLPDRRYVKVK